MAGVRDNAKKHKAEVLVIGNSMVRNVGVDHAEI